MQQKKLMFRVIAGGRNKLPELKKSVFKGKSIFDTDIFHDREQYKQFLAMNHVHRSADEGIDLDFAQVIRNKKLLREQAEYEGVTSADSFGKVLCDLRNRHSLNRQSAARWFAIIISEQAIFGEAAILRSADILIENLCDESRYSLFELGFSAKEIGELKLIKKEDRFGRTKEMLVEKGYLRERK